MRLFLCSHFAKTGTLLKDEVEGKNVVFIPTASKNEDYKAYVGSAQELWEDMKALVTELEISVEPISKIKKTIEEADIIYFTGGNSFFLIEQIMKTGVDKLIEKHIKSGKLYIGESAGAIVCAEDLSYIKLMDEVPGDYSRKDYSGLGLIDFFVVPHYLCPPFIESSQKIINKYPDLDICTLNNSQAVLVEDGVKKELSV